MIKKIILFIVFVTVLINILHYLAPWGYNTAGNKYMKNSEYAKAVTYFHKALVLNGNNKDYRYNYVTALSKLSPDLNVQKTVFKIANDEQNDSAQQLAKQIVRKWELNVRQNIGDNYIEQAIFHDGIVRWDKDKFPLKVYIRNESDKNLPDYYPLQINKALSQWQTTTGFIKFQTTDKLREANIIIKIVNLPDNVCEGNNCMYTVGYTVPNYRGKKLHNMTITLYATDPQETYFTDKELYNTVLHEIGHTLGIMGHSYNKNDLMYMSNENNKEYIQFRSTFQYLSSKDINTIKLLYKLEPDIINSDKYNKKDLIYAPIILGTSQDIKQRKLKEALNYVKKAPDVANGYIDLGIVYMQLEKPQEAAKAFKKAYQVSKSSQERYITAYNLALMYFDIGKYTEAKKAAELAKNEADTDEINKLITSILIRKK